MHQKKAEPSGHVVFTATEGKTFEVTPEGSIGLLALGAVGLEAWREARHRSKQEKKKDGTKTEEL